MVNSNHIIFASVSLDTNTNGTESHVYISCKQIKYAVQQEQHVSTKTRTKASN